MLGFQPLVFATWALAVLPLADAVAQAQNGSTIYRPKYEVHSHSTPRYENITGVTSNPMIRALQSTNSSHGLHKRADNGLPIGTCAPGTPCSNGACCSKTGVCGYSPDQCGTDGGALSCPLNVCCSQFGFCGTTDDFCDVECQSGFGTCGTVKEPSCSGSSASQRTIGYYEGWSSTRSCDKRIPSDLDVSAMTHINFGDYIFSSDLLSGVLTSKAFVYFHPTTFEIIPMSSGDVELYSQFTALKSRKPSLKTWVSIGGWAFNDATNSPNTQTAFSDMSSTPANRQAFATSLIQFMNTYGFDGVDIDWEYPGAEDRGGVKGDAANFATLLSDLKSAFAGKYGISVTLPSSYWYLRWFDLKAMEKSVDFLNFMSYDIHGVWDSSSKFTGPYVLPHTNLTEIRQGLDLLWRNNISPSIVNLGLGWYGRSFTLKDPSCNTPGCIFSEGGKAGECTKSAGTLSNSEIDRIISSNGLTPVMDKEAAVKWVTWDSDQWVSYDDGETMQMKLSFASKLCIGGTMIWSLDQDSSDGTSSNDLLGIGTANGVSAAVATTLREQKDSAEKSATLQSSCYWTFCGDECTTGYISETSAKGQVAGIQLDTTCDGDEVQMLCCAPGTNTGTCSWNGWRGVGFPCSTNSCPNGTDLIARNTNSYQEMAGMSGTYDLTCNGGSQSYCCSGFVPSSYKNTDDLKLVGQNGVTKRAAKSTEDPVCLQTFKALALMAGADVVWTYGRMMSKEYGAVFSNDYYQEQEDMCVKKNVVVSYEKQAGVNGVIASAANMFGQGAVGPGITELAKYKTTMTAKPAVAPKMRGAYQVATYGEKENDCAVTYTCRYGQGWDEVCDNQRWAIDQAFNGKTVYKMATAVVGRKKYKDTWSTSSKRGPWYATLAKPIVGGTGTWRGRYRCEVDEFPQAALAEAQNMAYQVVRFLNGPANAAQGRDFGDWKQAEYIPCSALREKANKPPPPITWEFSPFTEGDNRANANKAGQHYVQHYGWDSQTPGSECWATYIWTSGVLSGTSTVSDNGFRGLPDDPMYNNVYKWPATNKYNKPPSIQNMPAHVYSAAWLKREVARSVLQKELPLSAMYEVEKASDVLNEMSLSEPGAPPMPTPTDPLAYSDTQEEELESSHEFLGKDMPIETGSAHMLKHLHGHARRNHH
ncbi:glycoside hydrolase [Penicillium cf. griseofulvum]|nr:glycoside hydrolase [Penicillium cf. griseofulvum]